MNDKLMQLYNEITYHLINDEIPSSFLAVISKDDLFGNYPFNMLNDLKSTEQSLKFHPEGSVWNHTLMVVDEAARLKNKSENIKAFMWAALLHDIGKPKTFRKRGEKITAYNHDKVGAQMAYEFLKIFCNDEKFITDVCSLIRWHMQILFVAKNLPFADIAMMKKQVSLEEIALIGFCDRLGRGNVDRAKENKIIELFIKKCKTDYLN